MTDEPSNLTPQDPQGRQRVSGPRRVEVPTGVGSLVSFSEFPYDPGFVLTSDGWYSLVSMEEYDPATIASLLRNGGRVLFEGRKR